MIYLLVKWLIKVFLCFNLKVKLNFKFVEIFSFKIWFELVLEEKVIVIYFDWEKKNWFLSLKLFFLKWRREGEKEKKNMYDYSKLLGMRRMCFWEWLISKFDSGEIIGV